MRRRELLRAVVRNALLVLLLAGAYFGVDYIFTRSEKEVSQIKSRKDSAYYIETEGKMGMRVINDDGELAMEITGEKVTLSQDQKTAVFTGADATYYENGQVSLTMKAGEITYDTQTEDFVLKDGLDILTRDGMRVTAEEVLWRRAKSTSPSSFSADGRQKVPAFSFPKGVDVVSRDGNRLASSYMQADRELMYMEFVGNVRGDVASLSDTEFITERELTDVGQLKLEDIEKLAFEAEEVIYDKHKQVMLATSRFYDHAFKVMDPDGREVKIEAYQKDRKQVTFSKEDMTIRCNHIEAHIGRKWASASGNIEMVMPPSQPKQFGEDKALQVLRRYQTSIRSEDLEYFWGRDYVVTHSRSRLEQADRLAVADRITYWGEPDKKMVLLDGEIAVVNGSGQWMFDEDLIEVDNHDMRRAVGSYTELLGDRAVVYLNNNDFIASGNVRIRQDERDTAADTIVYEDQLKRITARGNVKFRDKDGQTFLCGGLVYHKQSDYIEVKGGALADIRLPAKFANDINKAIADAREKPAPPQIEDPPIAADLPSRNPNIGTAGSSLAPLTPSAPGRLPLPGEDAPVGGFIPDMPPINLPGEPGAAPPAEAGSSSSGPLLPPGTPGPAPSPKETEPLPQGDAAPPAAPNVADSDTKPKPVPDTRDQSRARETGQ